MAAPLTITPPPPRTWWRRPVPPGAGPWGYGATSDAHHGTAPHPTGGPAGRAVAPALREAPVTPGEPAYGNARGTDTALGGRLECEAPRQALGAGVLAELHLASGKGALGHRLGAAGAVEAVTTLQALRHGVAPPTVGLRRPDPALGPLDLVRTARKLSTRARTGELVGLSTSFRFGGHDAAQVLAAEGRS
ncbi:hypothetical protein ACFV2S_07510 [Streptomyces sp. NPDC059695]|uniref:hypothetical protein n=1 Tax=Streptomyces sp. NPDC059695 TaxID=3346910 RepID=UPI0036CDF7BB